MKRYPARTAAKMASRVLLGGLWKKIANYIEKLGKWQRQKFGFREFSEKSVKSPLFFVIIWTMCFHDFF